MDNAIFVEGSVANDEDIAEAIEDNIKTCKEYLKKLTDLQMSLEIELGITGGEEDGVDNSDVDVSKLYTQPEEVAYAYEELMKVSPLQKSYWNSTQ